jgi:hypothetical protein
MRLAAFVLGNATYDDAEAFPEIKYSENDARDVFDLMTVKPTGLFDPGLSRRILNASIDRVKDELESFFEPLSKEDFVLMFFACHGRSLNPRHLALAMRDTRDKRLSGSALDANMIGNYLSEKQIRRYALFLDCCRAGTVLDVPGFRSRGKSRREIKLNNLCGTGKWLIASCQGHENAHEEKTLGHGVFSHFLIQGIKEGKAVPPGSEFVDIHSLCVFTSTSIDEFYAEIGQEPVFSGGELKGQPLSIARNPAFKPRHENPEYLTEALTKIYGEEDLSSEAGFEKARSKRFREFLDLITPNTPAWERLTELHGLSLGITQNAVQAKIDSIRGQERFVQAGSGARRTSIASLLALQQATVPSGLALFVSSSATVHAYTHFDRGSLFNTFIAEGLHGSAADVNGVVTVRGLFEFISSRMILEDQGRQMPQLHMSGEHGDMSGFPITYGGGISELGGRRRALLVASDVYAREYMDLPHNERAVQAISAVLAEAGGFEVSTLLGREVTLHNVYAKVAAISHSSEPDDTVLFYFSGHCGFTQDQQYFLLMSDSDMSSPSTVLFARDLGPALRRRPKGATLVFVDSSFAGAINAAFQ